MSVNKRIVRKNRYKNDKRAKRASAGRVVGFWLKAILFATCFCMTGVMFIFGYDALTQCGYFSAEAITISGAERLSEEAILKAGELEYGKNLLSVNLVMVRKRLVAEPWIRSADIRREIPSRLIIRVEEHEPLAVLDLGRCFLIDRAGEIFKEAEPSEIDGMPIISGLTPSGWKKPGNRETKIYSAVMSALGEIRNRRDIFSGRAIQEISADREMGLTLRTSGPVEAVYLGYGDYAEKFHRLARLVDHIEADNGISEISLLDAHNPDRIVATPTARDTGEDEKEV